MNRDFRKNSLRLKRVGNALNITKLLSLSALRFFETLQFSRAFCVRLELTTYCGIQMLPLNTEQVFCFAHTQLV